MPSPLLCSWPSRPTPCRASMISAHGEQGKRRRRRRGRDRDSGWSLLLPPQPLCFSVDSHSCWIPTGILLHCVCVQCPPLLPLSPPSSLLQLFFWSKTLEFVISVGGAVLFCGFILFDTHLIMHRLSPEEYVLASVSLYLDFINLFLYILRILQAVRRD